MPDWSSSMEQTYEFYAVDPLTWKDLRLINNVKSCTISRDSTVETLGSATFDISESTGECYIRVYLVTVQNGIRERHPLGTFLVQSPSVGFDGRVQTISMDAYTPLLELKENMPPIGYHIPKGENIMDIASRLTREYVRAPVIKTTNSATLINNFVADTDDTWLAFLSDLITNAKYEYSLDEMGRILFSPEQDVASLQPVWTYNDDNSSILLPELTVDHDLFGIPNVVEVVYSDGNGYRYAKAVNDDSNSPTSTVSRGREIKHRVTDPGFVGDIDEYAKQVLRDISALEYTISYTHGYCPVRLGDCVRLNYEKAGLYNVKAKVISQKIKCESGCQVTEKAVFTTKLWR